jgi:hypothetical protein
MNRNIIQPLAAAALLSMAGAAHASSDEAWKQLAADVEAKCKKAAVTIEKPSATVDPFGSSHYGLALVTGKQKKTVEIGSELDAKQLGLVPAK